MHRTGLDVGETRLRAAQLVRDRIDQQVRPVHGSTKGTSGVLLFALDAATARAMGLAFERSEAMRRPPARWCAAGHQSRARSNASALPDDMRTAEREEIWDASDRLSPAATAELPLAQAISRARAAWSSCSPSPAAGTSCAGMKHVAPIIGDATHGKDR